jgi:hypothetical protein
MVEPALYRESGDKVDSVKARLEALEKERLLRISGGMSWRR